jgi:hypothetical protein
MPNGEMIHFRATTEEAQRIRDRAMAANLSVSDFLRQCIQASPSVPVCGHCEKIRRRVEEWLDLVRHMPVDDKLSWRVDKYREAVRRLLPPIRPREPSQCGVSTSLTPTQSP